MTKLIGVDIGGTFTDIVVLDQDRQSLEIAKVSSTPRDPARGMVAGLDELQICGDQIDLLVTAPPLQPMQCWNARGAAVAS